jgi:hypothetical protein
MGEKGDPTFATYCGKHVVMPAMPPRALVASGQHVGHSWAMRVVKFMGSRVQLTFRIPMLYAV